MVPTSNYLLLIWKDPETRRNYTVGKLTRGDFFTFQYYGEAENAEEAGWKLLGAFPTYQEYRSNTMFPVFSSRLPDKKRRDIQNILEKYGLMEYDEFELLRRSGARLPIDTYEFIDPILPDGKEIEREFYITGIRYHSACQGSDCGALPGVKVGDMLLLEEEPKNAYDPLAIRVLTQEQEVLGYVPRYYNKAILARLHDGMGYSCKITEVNANMRNCSECLKARLTMPGT